MSTAERLLAYVAIVGVLTGTVAAMVSGAEMFPFSSYPMYSSVTRAPVELGRFVGVVHDSDGSEREIAISRAAYLYPFSERTLRSAVSRIVREDGRDAAARALADELAVYNARVATHGGAHLDGLRYYTMILKSGGSGELVAERGPLVVESE
jgi:hypothetical protein